ncbi:MAG: Do family serine endopeptidase [Alphaproteobacteria bacterium]
MVGLLAVGVNAAHAQQATLPQNAAGLRLSFAPVVKRVSPSVVNVYAKQIIRQRRRSPIFNDPFFRRFFGKGLGGPRQRVKNSLGSGVLVSRKGVVVTNNHVIKDSTEIRVALADGREFEAQVLLKDERTDLAVLRIGGGQGEFPALEFADSDEVEVGDLVLAIGNPFGVGQTVTSGIVSALARTGVGVTDFRFFIQTDAAINPGNSGGPLIDSLGRVIGINTAIYSRSGGSIGIGFAIPSNMVRFVVQSAKAGKIVRRPWLGGEFQKLTAGIATSLGLDRPRGALVAGLVASGPLAQSGVARGDVIVAVDGREVADPQALVYRVTTKGLGKSANLTIARGARRFTVAVALQPAPENPPRNTTRLDTAPALAGARVANLSPALAEELQLPQSRQGVIVLTVEPRSGANVTGLKPQDIVVAIDGVRIGLVSDLLALEKQIDQLFEITIRRKGRVITSVVRN